MLAVDFIARWRSADLTERAAAQSHFRDLCEADVVIDNPPFLGGKLQRSVLGNDYVERLFAAYAGRVPAEADLVVYWFAKAWERMSSLSAPGGGEGRGEVGDSRVPADQPT
jgi:hypothetical protein